MKTYLENDLSQIDHLLDIIKKQSISYLDTISDRRTSVEHDVFFDHESLPEEGYGAEKVLEIFNERFEQAIVGSSGPRYWGYVTGGSTPASIAGDWLASVYDQNTQSSKGQGDVSAMIELEAINLMLDLLGLPKSFLGGFVTGATMSNFTCMAVARQWIGKQKGEDIAKNGISSPLKVLTATPHSSSLK